MYRARAAGGEGEEQPGVTGSGNRFVTTRKAQQADKALTGLAGQQADQCQRKSAVAERHRVVGSRCCEERSGAMKTDSQGWLRRMDGTNRMNKSEV
jgi:hypothetical protein